MKTIHPFPARMASDIALRMIERLPYGAVVCDPMSGSGTVAAASQALGFRSYAYDVDPLAILITSVRCMEHSAVWRGLALADSFLKYCEKDDKVCLPWIDHCAQTEEYVSYWFGPKQTNKLRRAARFLAYSQMCKSDPDAANMLRLALSRIIIKKTGGASLAWDVSHSRPHKVYDAKEYGFDVVAELHESLICVAQMLFGRDLAATCVARLGDAKVLPGLKEGSVDAIVTSPPYLNAIDYMRGHRLALVWLGWSIPTLRRIRSAAVGSEVGGSDADLRPDEKAVMRAYPQAQGRQKQMVNRYVRDLLQITRRAAHVLRPGGLAVYVIGDNVLRGVQLSNSSALVKALGRSGFKVASVETRDIPAHHRYLPVNVAATNALANRMRHEVVISAVRRG